MTLKRSLDAWYATASLRTPAGPLTLDGDGAWFDPALQPHAAHAKVLGIGPECVASLLRRALVRYLDLTLALELDGVNPVASALARGHGPLDLSATQQRLALQLYCDEGFHALRAHELRDALGAGAAKAPAVLRRLDALLDEVAPEDREAVRFAFAVVSETTISASLRRLTKAGHVHPVVRAMAEEHANDEARHAAFFADAFRTWWGRLEPAGRARVEPLLPRLLDAFLRPDLDAITDDLTTVGFDTDDARRITSESWPDGAVQALIRLGAGPALVCLRRGGARLEVA